MASNEKVVLCGITFDKDTDIFLGALQRKQNGDFYGITFQKDKEYLNSLNEYLNGGERYIDISTNQIYTFNKKINMWIGEGEQLQFHTIKVNRIGEAYNDFIECLILEDDGGDYKLYIIDGGIHYCLFENAPVLTDKYGRKYIKFGNIENPPEDSERIYRKEVKCKYDFGFEYKYHDGTIRFYDTDVFLIFNDNFDADTVNGYVSARRINGYIRSDKS